MKKVLHVVGARPNYPKTAPLWRAFGRRGRVQQSLVHTGQHYDATMSDVLFRDLGLPAPDLHLGVGSGSDGEQTAAVIVGMERELSRLRPDLVIVVGDVNSTLGAALAAVKLGIPVAHVEAGLRSRDRSMPEEWNRMLTDQIADVLLTHSPEADDNLIHEGRPLEAIHRVGNVMIDSLVAALDAATRSDVHARLGVGGRYGVVTLHRPLNVDSEETLAVLLATLAEVAHRLPLVFPVHPRTRRRLTPGQAPGLHICDPLGYVDFVALERRATLAITDSGGVQEETTYLGVPCLTVRPSTERPVTITEGTNRLVPPTREAVTSAVDEILSGRVRPGRVPQMWDGRAAERIADVVERFLGVG